MARMKRINSRRPFKEIAFRRTARHLARKEGRWQPSVASSPLSAWPTGCFAFFRPSFHFFDSLREQNAIFVAVILISLYFALVLAIVILSANF